MSAKRLLLLALFAVALAAAVFYALTPSRGTKQDSSARDNTLATAFHVFRTPVEDLSQAEARRIRAGLKANGLAGATDTHLAATGQGRLWVFTTADHMCISHMRGMACDRKRRATHEGLFLGVFDPPDEDRRDPHNFLVQGIAPDDVGRVQVLIDSRYLTVDVKENVFSVTANKPIHIKRLLRD
jgi:hypothetical protein